MAVCEMIGMANTKRRTLDEVRQDYHVRDVDTCVLLDHFEDVPGRLVLEVGSHDESSDAASIIAKSGQHVIGIDLREPNHAEANQVYEYLRADFCDLPPQFIRHYTGRIDAIFSISAIEHFGLNAYGETPAGPFYDVLAMRQMWQLLKPGGKAYITVPYGKRFQVFHPYWYMYDRDAVRNRLIGDFGVEAAHLFTSAEAVINGVQRPRGCGLTKAEADTYDDMVYPHVTIFLKLAKRPVDRAKSTNK